MRDITAYLSITRPLNAGLTALSIFVAAFLARPSIPTLPVVFAILSGMLITAGANVCNDLCDVEIDRINRPNRVLPAGRMSLAAARLHAIILFACGLFFSILISLGAAMIAVCVTIMMVIYNIRLKRKPLTGNLAVSLSTALAFIFGALAAFEGNPELHRSELPIGDWRVGIFPAAFSFLFHLGREVIKDIEDQAGDQAVKARTLPLAFGLKPAQMTVTVAFLVLAVVVLIPFYAGLYHWPYLWCIVLGIYPVLIYALFQVWRNPNTGQMRFTSAMLKADMIIGLLAVFLGNNGM